jgi:outer membrane protein OmpA-like peptidoglycan-associated protein
MNTHHAKKLMLFGVLASSGALAACRGQTSRESPIFGIRNMYDQERYDIQSESEFFTDKRTMRPLPEGVVSTEQETDVRISQGRLNDQTGYVLTIPSEVIERGGGMSAMLKRGQERYGIYCTPCHDATGNGNGVVKQRAVASGAAAFIPPNFHDDKYRHMPDGQLYATISNGKGNMPPYAHSIPVQDRWTIVSYVRALQLANATLPGVTKPAPAPPPPPPVVHHVAMKNDHFEIDQKINFATGKDEILADSNVLIDEIADAIKGAPSIKSVEVQGHTDATGDKAANVKLSAARAKAVVAALVARGVTKDKLTAKGFGPDKPIADNKTPEGQDKNRRVEFLIVTTPKDH